MRQDGLTRNMPGKPALHQPTASDNSESRLQPSAPGADPRVNRLLGDFGQDGKSASQEISVEDLIDYVVRRIRYLANNPTYTLSEEESMNLRSVFEKVDRNRDGRVLV